MTYFLSNNLNFDEKNQCFIFVSNGTLNEIWNIDKDFFLCVVVVTRFFLLFKKAFVRVKKRVKIDAF